MPDATQERPVLPPLAPVVLWLATAKLHIHLFAGRHYGYFVDELYYLACSRHLDWGYVDQPPLIAAIAWLVRSVLGDSLQAVRLLPALAGAGEVALTGLLARELGAAAFAQGFAALATLAAPGISTMDSFLSMNAFEPLFWLGCAWLVLRIVNTGNPKLWLYFGLLAGLGVENKYSMLMLGAGLVLGFILTPQRRLLGNRWPWLAAVLVLVFFLPNLLWNVHRHFPFLELQANIRRSGRDVALTPWAFFGQEILAMNPISLPLWFAGLWFFFSPRGRTWRALGWAWLFTAAVIATLSPRIYYLFPAFPLLFAAGAVCVKTGSASPASPCRKSSGPPPWPWSAVSSPPSPYLCWRPKPTLPMRTPCTSISLPSKTIGSAPCRKSSPISSAGPKWRDRCPGFQPSSTRYPLPHRIFAQNYGEAGAIDLFGPEYGLPPAISGHQSYFLWGPRGYTGESMIVMDGTESVLKRQFASVEKAGTVDHPYSMPYRHFDIFYCRGLKQPLAAFWPQVKKWTRPPLQRGAWIETEAAPHAPALGVQARPFKSFPKQTLTSVNAPLRQATRNAPFGNPGFDRSNSVSMVPGLSLVASSSDVICTGNCTAERACSTAVK